MELGMYECEHCIKWCKDLVSYLSDVSSGILVAVLCGRETLTNPFSDIWAAIKRLLWFCMYITQGLNNTLDPVGQ